MIDLSLTISIILNVNRLNTPFESQRFSDAIKTARCLQKKQFKYKGKSRLEEKVGKDHANSNQKQVE